MKDNQFETDNSTAEIVERMLQLSREATQPSDEASSSLSINQSRTINSVKVDIHIVNQRPQGLLRKLFAKLF